MTNERSAKSILAEMHELNDQRENIKYMLLALSQDLERAQKTCDHQWADTGTVFYTSPSDNEEERGLRLGNAVVVDKVSYTPVVMNDDRGPRFVLTHGLKRLRICSLCSLEEKE